MLTQKNSLVDRFRDAAGHSPDQFPDSNGPIHVRQYDSVVDYLDKEYYPYIEASAAMQDSIFLTKHGKGHIETVVRRASEMVHLLKITLSGYEFYLLLLAIHFHDVGNLYGRKEHEQQIGRILQQFESLLSSVIERNYIKRIARAHGGHLAGNPQDKDTLGALESGNSVTDIRGGVRVRLPLLAAILRLADELADDSTRTSETVLRENLASRSEVYHKYALSLDSVLIDPDGRKVELKFAFYAVDTIRTWQCDDEQLFLIDYIYERTLKMYFECIYCMRFARSNAPDMIPLEAVKVQVEIYGTTPDGDEDVLERIVYTLRESGYPTTHGKIFDLCPELNGMDGAKLKKTIQAKGQTTDDQRTPPKPLRGTNSRTHQRRRHIFTLCKRIFRF